MSDWHVSFGMGEDSGSYLSYLSWGFGWIKQIIEEIVKIIRTATQFCPYCGISLKHNIYYVRDIFTDEKIFRCSRCFGQVVWNGRRWVKT